MSHGYTKRKKERKKFNERLKNAVLSNDQSEVLTLRTENPSLFDDIVSKAKKKAKENP